MCWAIPALCVQHVDVEGGLFWNFEMVTAATPVHPCRSRVPKCIVDCVGPSHPSAIPSPHRLPKMPPSTADCFGTVLEFWNSDCVTTHAPLLFTLSKMYRRYCKLLIYVTYILVMSGRWWQQPMRSVWKQHQQSCLVTLTSLITGTPSQSYLEKDIPMFHPHVYLLLF